MGLTSITHIPSIMRANGFQQGAQLMELWFSRPAIAYPRYTDSNLSIIKMDWVLSFGRAKKVYQEILDDEIWVNAAAKAEIKTMLDRTIGLPVGMRVKFAPQTGLMDQVDEDYINHRAVDGVEHRIDGLDAALGRFDLRVLVAGTVEPGTLDKLAAATSPYDVYPHRQEAQIVNITDVGVYVADSYDFDGQQALGIWNEDNNSASMNYLMANEFARGREANQYVGNYSFREWRKANNRGGDFRVFSDIKWTHLDPPSTFAIPT
jgi:hypothetical protein